MNPFPFGKRERVRPSVGVLSQVLRPGGAHFVDVRLEDKGPRPGQGINNVQQPPVVSEVAVPPPEDEDLYFAAEERMLQPTEDTDTEPDEGALPKGAGYRGLGPPLTVGSGSRRRPLYDGGGLCSPGRWPPHRRPCVPSDLLAALRELAMRNLRDWLRNDGRTASEVLQGLFRGEASSSPFPGEFVEQLVEAFFTRLGDRARVRPQDRGCVIRLRMLQAILVEARDPDAAIISEYIEGVPIGVGVRLPRTPAVFDRRTKWSLPEQRLKEAHLADPLSFDWRTNYLSTEPHLEEVERQLEELVSNGKAMKLSEEAARRRWPGAVPASLGALEKVGAEGQVTIRLLFDGSQGVDVNKRIRQRDQYRGPSAPDLKRYLRGIADTGRRAVTLTADVEDAHRLVNIRAQDWRHQICRATVGGSVYSFMVGVFGVSSISYWWGRLAGAGLRALHYLSSPSEGLWALLVADDFKFESTSEAPEFSLLYVILVLIVLGFPLKWRKTAGGSEVEWVGYHLDLRTHSLGLSERRAAWAVGWCTTMADAGATRVSDFRDGLGRLSFAVGALEHERPFLSPLYAFVSRHPTGAIRQLPTFARLLLKYLARRIAARRHYPCAIRKSPIAHAPRVDARAAGDQIGIGGWLPMNGADGRISTSASPWFSVTLDRESAPWAYTKGGQPFRTIAALEGLAMVYAVKCFRPWLGTSGFGCVHFPSFTDNQGNSHALNRLMTSRFPLICVIMELATILDEHDLRMQVTWTPREFNSQADALSNGVLEGFAPERRIDADPKTMNWQVLDRAMAEGTQYYQELPKPYTGPPARKRARQERLRVRDPW